MLPASYPKYLPVLVLMVLLSCSSQTETKDDILRLDLRKAEKVGLYNASEVISSIEYVALETSSQSLIGGLSGIEVSENYILTFNEPDWFLLFSRQGQFIRRIGQRGNGPADYTNWPYRVGIDEQSGLVYLLGSLEIIAYRITGEFVKRLRIDEMRKKIRVVQLARDGGLRAVTEVI